MRHCTHGVVWCLLCVTWLIRVRVYDMTHSCTGHDSFICVTWHGGGAWCGVVSRWDVRRRDASLRKHVKRNTLICAHASNAIYRHIRCTQWRAYIQIYVHTYNLICKTCHYALYICTYFSFGLKFIRTHMLCDLPDALLRAIYMYMYMSIEVMYICTWYHCPKKLNMSRTQNIYLSLDLHDAPLRACKSNQRDGEKGAYYLYMSNSKADSGKIKSNYCTFQWSNICAALRARRQRGLGAQKRGAQRGRR